MNHEIKIGSNRSFGIVFFIVFFLIGLYTYLNGRNISFIFIIFSLIFLILGLLNSKILNPLNKLWFKFGLFLGKIISPVVMSAIFFLVVTPTGLIMKLIKKDILNLKFNKSKTYWLEKDKNKSTMKNQF